MQLLDKQRRRRVPSSTRGNYNQHGPRRVPRIETLERRLLLSCVPLPTNSDAQMPSDTQPAATPAQAIIAPATTQPAVVELPASIPSSTGNVRIQLPETATEVVVRQFIDYRLQAVVEVQAGPHWLSFPSDSVDQLELVLRHRQSARHTGPTSNQASSRR